MAKDDLIRFHLTDAKGRPTGVFDFRVFEHIKQEQRMLVMGGTVYLYRHGVYRPDESGAQVKTMIRECILPQFIKSNTLKRVHDLFLCDADLQVTFENLNDYPPYWINFRNAFYDTRTGRMVPHGSQYRAISQIPHEYRPEANPEGTVMKKFLRDLCPNQDDLEMLLEYVGLCMTRDTSPQRFLVLCGTAGSGKSTMISLINAVIGDENCSHVPLDALNQRFAAYDLVGKLLNSCADLRISALEDVSVLKQLTGEDYLRAEAKGRMAFSFKSFAKLVFSVNEMPLVRNERTQAFYRRLLVLMINRAPDSSEKDPRLLEKLTQPDEIDYLIHAAVSALERMYQRGAIAESASSIAAVRQLRHDSDTVEAFLEEEEPAGRIERVDLYHRYEDFCRSSDRQSLARTGFYRALRSRGYQERRTADGRYFDFEKISDTFSEKTVTKVSLTCQKTVTDERFEEPEEPTPFD